MENDMVLKGYRVTPLDKHGQIENEVGQYHYFSTSPERAAFWAYTLPNLIGDARVPEASKMALFGHAIMEVEATNVKEDTLAGSNEDYSGLILSAKRIDEDINFRHYRPDTEKCEMLEETKAVSHVDNPLMHLCYGEAVSSKPKRKGLAYLEQLLSNLSCSINLPSKRNFEA